MIALPGGLDEYPFREKETILICGRQPEVIQAALEMGVSCIILCQAELPADLRDKGGDTCIIATPYDPYRTMRMVFQAIPAGCVCRRDDIQYFHLDDYIDDVREVVLQSRYRSYPILDQEDKVVGTLSRFHLIRPRRKRVVLVDHNEVAQSVPGLDQTDILEIIDHHRLADIQTNNPIWFRNEPVGSTTTYRGWDVPGAGDHALQEDGGAHGLGDRVRHSDVQISHLLPRRIGIPPSGWRAWQGFLWISWTGYLCRLRTGGQAGKRAAVRGLQGVPHCRA